MHTALICFKHLNTIKTRILQITEWSLLLLDRQTDLEVAFISVAAVCLRAEPRSRISNTSDLFLTTTSSSPCMITDPWQNIQYIVKVSTTEEAFLVSKVVLSAPIPGWFFCCFFPPQWNHFQNHHVNSIKYINGNHTFSIYIYLTICILSNIKFKI